VREGKRSTIASALVASMAAFAVALVHQPVATAAVPPTAASVEITPAAEQRILGGTGKTCGPDSGSQGGQCILEATGFPGGAVQVHIDVSGSFRNPTEWTLLNLTKGGECSGSFVPADEGRSWTCTIAAGTLTLVTFRPPGASAEIAVRW